MCCTGWPNTLNPPASASWLLGFIGVGHGTQLQRPILKCLYHGLRSVLIIISWAASCFNFENKTQHILCIWNTKETSFCDIFVQSQMTDSLTLLLMLCLLWKLHQETANHPMEFPGTWEQLNHYRNVAENVQSELAATLVKFECAQSEVRHCTHFTTKKGILLAFHIVKPDSKQGILTYWQRLDLLSCVLSTSNSILAFRFQWCLYNLGDTWGLWVKVAWALGNLKPPSECLPLIWIACIPEFLEGFLISLHVGVLIVWANSNAD